MPLFGPNLDRLRDNGDVAGLAALLRNNKEATRFGAALRLGELRDPRGVEPLIDALGDDAENVRHAAWAALVKIGAAALEPLRDAAQDRHRGVQRQAAATLELLESELDAARPSSLASSAGSTSTSAPRVQSDHAPVAATLLASWLRSSKPSAESRTSWSTTRSSSGSSW